jgi:hypothetical protein
MCMFRARIVPTTLAGVLTIHCSILAIETSSKFALVSTPTYKERSHIQNVSRQTGSKPSTSDAQARRRKENFKKHLNKYGVTIWTG